MLRLSIRNWIVKQVLGCLVPSFCGFKKCAEEIVADVLGVEVFRETVAGNSLVGTYAALSNRGGLVHPHVSVEEMQQLSTLLQVLWCVRNGDVHLRSLTDSPYGRDC